MKRLTSSSSWKTLPHIHEPKHELHVDNKTLYNTILKVLNGVKAEYLITTGQRLSLGKYLGDLQIIRYKPKKLPLNHVETHKQGKPVYYTNFHTGGYILKLHWYKYHLAKFRHQRIWKFKFTRSHLRYNELSMANYAREHGVSQYKVL